MTRQEELEAMSDLHLGGEVSAANDDELEDALYKDYCNNPNDIMPIAIENKINMTWCHEGFWCCDSNEPLDKIKLCENESLYRAICILFILMSESKS